MSATDDIDNGNVTENHEIDMTDATTGEEPTMTDTESKEHEDDTTADAVDAATDGQAAEPIADQSAVADDAATDAAAEPAHPAEQVQFSIVFDDDDEHDDVADLADVSVAADGVTDAGVADASAASAAGSAVADSADGAGAGEGEDDGVAAEGAATVASHDSVAAENAAKVAQTLSLGKKASAAASGTANADKNTVKAPAALRLSERLDKELGGNAADKVLLKSYPSLALNKVTVTDGKTGHNTLDRVSADFYAGHIYAVKVESDDERVALLSVMTGMTRPNDGAVMNKSLNVLEIEPGELRGHRLGIIPQRYAVRADLNAEQNVLYAMNASGRTFLKPKPVIARELLQRVGFDSETPNTAVGKLPLVQQRLVAIARAISCDAEVIIADEPTGGLDADESVAVLKTLIGLTHGDPKRCVIVVTGDDEVAEVAERVTYLSD
ncbi:ATP-binding cassette domain-containing protein [Bifidobacterium simiiventris]|uniref:ATP-binding cassette domain-containing protein n=1 Tax=Bifidobacterium simiiventris TaxID=2834434 RepID=UPI001F2AA885|nr:ATP-binding cassette domain-containing protein [Bifidobacterium simiiventris]